MTVGAARLEGGLSGRPRYAQTPVRRALQSLEDEGRAQFPPPHCLPCGGGGVRTTVPRTLDAPGLWKRPRTLMGKGVFGREAAATLMEGPGILTEVLHRYRGWGLGELAFR